ncbi:MAG: polysaccharide biosynthesis C-terminal domain-containing protein [Qipengyuania sp.]|uniref:oligosaccharide flippase family protein n=1 Tax=Qipengyuania sp. TaxID=2004515 RepID=UPI00300274F0
MARQLLLRHVKARLKSGSLKRFALTMLAAVGARLSLLVLAIIAGRTFGPAAFGTFTFATGAALVAAQLAGMGWPHLMNRMMPRLLIKQDWGALRGLLRGGFSVVLASSLLCSIAFHASSYLAGDLSLSFTLAALLVPGLALCILRRQQLAALRMPQVGMLFDQGFGAFLVVVALLVLGSLTLFQLTAFYAAATLLGVLISTLLLKRILPSETFRVKPKIAWKAWMLTAMPIMLGMSAKLISAKVDVLLLAPLADLTETGIYGAAWRLTYVLTFPQVVLMTLVTPALSNAFTDGDMARAHRVMKLSLLFTALSSVPLAAAILFAAEPIMALVFGSEFAEGAGPLRILALGQTAASFSMVFASILVMGTREGAFAVVNVTALAVVVILCLALIPIYGGMGAAIAVASTAAVSLVIQAWLGLDWIRRQSNFKYDPSGSSRT